MCLSAGRRRRAAYHFCRRRTDEPEQTVPTCSLPSFKSRFPIVIIAFQAPERLLFLLFRKGERGAEISLFFSALSLMRSDRVRQLGEASGRPPPPEKCCPTGLLLRRMEAKVRAECGQANVFVRLNSWQAEAGWSWMRITVSSQDLLDFRNI